MTAANRTLRGGPAECTASPFLPSIDPALLDRRGTADRIDPRRPATEQTTLF